jgi:hypothetical protein
MSSCENLPSLFFVSGTPASVSPSEKWGQWVDQAPGVAWRVECGHPCCVGSAQGGPERLQLLCSVESPVESMAEKSRRMAAVLGRNEEVPLIRSLPVTLPHLQDCFNLLVDDDMHRRLSHGGDLGLVSSC